MSTPAPGTPWTKPEILVVMDAYKRMLDMQRAGESFSKAAVRREIESDLPARSPKSIDLKWCNISAVLAEHGLEWVEGLKPMTHLQSVLRKSVEERLDEFAAEEPAPPTESVRARMRNTPQRDTPFEVAVRSEAHRRGLRYRVDARVEGVSRSRPDLVFPSARLAVYLDGCFWHWCPEHSTRPKHNESWWTEKLLSNVQRDRRHVREFAEAGWMTLRFWEHEDPNDIVDVIQRVVGEARCG